MTPKVGKFKKFLVAAILVTQIVTCCTFLFVPQKTEAVLGVGDVSFDTIIANIYDIAKEAGLAALRRIALNYANKYLNRFIDKVVDKYKIRSFLYYDQVLTDYYLVNWIKDKVDDPELEEIYLILEKTYVAGSGQYKGTGVNPANMPLPQLRRAIAKLYTKQTGIDPNMIATPPANLATSDYLNYSQYYYLNHSGASAASIEANFQGQRNASNTASQLEQLANPGGLKSSRAAGGICTFAAGYDVAKNPGDPDPNNSRTTCEGYYGGEWSENVLGQARQFINNPAGFIDKHLTSALEKLFGTTYDPNNIWSAIGDLFGQYLFNKLDLDSSTSGGLNEYNLEYLSESGSQGTPDEIDLDGDGIPEGEDNNNDGQLLDSFDTCYHGGIANQPTADLTGTSGCKRSSVVGSSPFFTPFCQAIDKAIYEINKWLDFAELNEDQIDTDNFENEADVDNWSRHTLDLSNAIDGLSRALSNFRNLNYNEAEVEFGRFANYVASIEDSLLQDGDIELDDQWGDYDGIETIIENIQEYLDYVLEIKTAINKCNAPELDNLTTVPAPNYNTNPAAGGGGGGGGTPTTPPADALTAHPSQLAVIETAKSQLASEGVSTVGLCGAYNITNRVATLLQAQVPPNMGGLKFDPGGLQCNNLAIDVIMYSDGYAYDILDSEGVSNFSQWVPLVSVDPGLYRNPQ